MSGPYGNPVAVQKGREWAWSYPDGGHYEIALYPDGTIWTGNNRRLKAAISMAGIRQIMAELEFGYAGYEGLEWSLALWRANARASSRDGKPR